MERTSCRDAAGAPPCVFSPRLQAALGLLLESREYARQLGRDRWDFALEIANLRGAGLSNSDLRWLVCVGYVEHAREVTRADEAGRAFRPLGNLALTRRTCFVLTDAGAAVAQRGPRVAEVAAPSSNGEDQPKIAVPAAEVEPASGVPHWDADMQELRVNGVLVKRFKVPSPNQEMVLSAFEEDGWPRRIDDPIPPHPSHDPKRRLHDTINTLNRNQKHPLIRFLGDGSGQGVRWELCPQGAAGGDEDAGQ